MVGMHIFSWTLGVLCIFSNLIKDPEKKFVEEVAKKVESYDSRLVCRSKGAEEGVRYLSFQVQTPLSQEEVLALSQRLLTTFAEIQGIETTLIFQKSFQGEYYQVVLKGGVSEVLLLP